MDRHESHKRGKKGKKKNYHRLKGGDKRNGGLADDAATPRTFSARTYWNSSRFIEHFSHTTIMLGTTF